MCGENTMMQGCFQSPKSVTILIVILTGYKENFVYYIQSESFILISATITMCSCLAQINKSLLSIHHG